MKITVKEDLFSINGYFNLCLWINTAKRQKAYNFQTVNLI